MWARQRHATPLRALPATRRALAARRSAPTRLQLLRCSERSFDAGDLDAVDALSSELSERTREQTAATARSRAELLWSVGQVRACAALWPQLCSG